MRGAGGDWGSIISATLAREYSERCRAIHLNLELKGLGFRLLGQTLAPATDGLLAAVGCLSLDAHACAAQAATGGPSSARRWRGSTRSAAARSTSTWSSPGRAGATPGTCYGWPICCCWLPRSLDAHACAAQAATGGPSSARRWRGEYPERCRAIHLNLVFAGPCWSKPLAPAADGQPAAGAEPLPDVPVARRDEVGYGRPALPGARDWRALVMLAAYSQQSLSA